MGVSSSRCVVQQPTKSEERCLHIQAESRHHQLAAVVGKRYVMSGEKSPNASVIATGIAMQNYGIAHVIAPLSRHPARSQSWRLKLKGCV
jgi:hypothetical protein